MQAIHTRVACVSGLLLMLLVASAGSATGGEPLSAPGFRHALNEISLVDALQLSPSFLASALEVSCDASRDSQAKFALLDGFNKLRKGDPKSAIEALTAAIEAKPTDPASYWLRARALAEDNQTARAKEDCHQALEIDNQFIPAQLTLAALILETDGAAAALQMIEANCSPKGDHGDVSYEHYLKAVAYLKNAQPELAVDHFEIALRESSTYLQLPTDELWFLKSVAHAEAGELKKALQSARRSVEANEKNARSLALVWSLHRKLGNHLAAFEMAKRLSDSETENVKYKLAKLSSLVDLKQYRAAEGEATEILSIEPENTIARQVLESIHTARASSQTRLK